MTHSDPTRPSAAGQAPPDDEAGEGVPAAPGAADAADAAGAAGAADSAGVELERLRARARESDELKDRIRRLEAEFVNETRRIRRLAEADRKYAVEKVVVELLPVLDALERAAGEAAQTEVDARFLEGIGLVRRELAGLLERHGVERVEPAGEPFDPARHEAMTMRETTEVPPGHVCQVMRHGYLLHARVLRPAQVVVARAPAPAPGPDPAGPDAGPAHPPSTDPGGGPPADAPDRAQEE